MDASRVVIIKSPGVFAASGTPDPAVVARMFARGLALLTGEGAGGRAAADLFRSGDRVGIKVNTIGGKALSTRPEVAHALAAWLAENGLEERNIVIWDRTARELREAGYAPGPGRPGVRVLARTRTGVATRPDSSLTSTSAASFPDPDGIHDGSISLAILKDHGLAGVTAGMKNISGPSTIPTNITTTGATLSSPRSSMPRRSSRGTD
jgi:hypothetical protein